MEVSGKDSVWFSRRPTLGTEEKLFGRVAGGGCWKKNKGRWAFQRQPTQEPMGFALGLGGLASHTQRSPHFWAGMDSDTTYRPQTPAGAGTLPQPRWCEAWGRNVVKFLLLTQRRPQQCVEIPWWKMIFLTFLLALKFSSRFSWAVFLSSKLWRDGSMFPKWGGKAHLWL